MLRREVEIAQRAFDLIAQRASQTSVESQNSQTNIAVLNAAAAHRALAPRILLKRAGGRVPGTLLGIGLALMLELANRRVRSADDLTEALDLPVLGAIASRRGMFKRSGRRKGTATAQGPRHEHHHRIHGQRVAAPRRRPFTSRSIGDILVAAGTPERHRRRAHPAAPASGQAAVRRCRAAPAADQDDIDFALSKQFDYAYPSETDTSRSPELVAAFRPSAAWARTCARCAAS